MISDVKISLEVLLDNSFKTIGQGMIEAILLNARGNSGMLLSEFNTQAGVLEALGDLDNTKKNFKRSLENDRINSRNCSLK